MELHQTHLFKICFQSPYNIAPSPFPGLEWKSRHPCLESPDSPVPSTCKVVPDFTDEETEAQTHWEWHWSPTLWILSPISATLCCLQHKAESDKVIQDLGVVGFLTHKGAPASFSRAFLNRVASAAPANPD